jgi:signal transduction histidine kinase
MGAEIGLGSTVTPEGARFWVRDTGTGVVAEDRERIFERLERGSNEARAGAGLGLAIVAAIARAHGGQAGFSPRQTGTDAWIALPALIESSSSAHTTP